MIGSCNRKYCRSLMCMLLYYLPMFTYLMYTLWRLLIACIDFFLKGPLDPSAEDETVCYEKKNTVLSFWTMWLQMCCLVCYMTPTGERNFGCLLLCLESKRCRLIPFYYLLSCSSAYSHCSLSHVFFGLSVYLPILLTFSRKFFAIFRVEVRYLVWLLFSS